MANLLAQLLSDPVKRTDRTVLAPSKRLPPSMPREFFDILGVMGRAATAEALRATLELRLADKTLLTYAVLGRWPTEGEMARQADMQTWLHLRRLLTGKEFRGAIGRLALTALPEKQRLLLVDVPGATPPSVAAGLAAQHCVVPADLLDVTEFDDIVVRLGAAFSRLATTRTVAVSLPSLHPFVLPVPPKLGGRPDPLSWGSMPPPFRPVDTLFTVLRPPADVLLRRAQTTVAGWRAGTARPPQGTVLPAADDTPGWKALILARLREMLEAPDHGNPLCRALGDGTAAGALALMRRFPIRLVHIEAIDDWLRSGVGADPYDLPGEPKLVLTEAELPPPLRRRLADALDQDLQLWARFTAVCDPKAMASVTGPQLA